MTDFEERVRCQLVMSAHKAGWNSLQPMLRQMLVNNPADEYFIQPRMKLSQQSVWQAIKSAFHNVRS